MAIAQEIGSRTWGAEWSWHLGQIYEGTDPARAVELMSIRVAYQREIGYPDAKAHAERVEAIRRRVEGNG